MIFIAACALTTRAQAVFSQSNTATAPASMVTPPPLAPFAAESSPGLNPAWRLSGLPGNRVALTQFEPGLVQGESALRIRTQQSYGVLTHSWRGTAPADLAWRWQLVQGLAQADIRTKNADDAALKVCVMFDQPLHDIPFVQRVSLSLARAASGQALPSATLCYLWDSRYPAGTRGTNPYSARVRYIVLNGVETTPGQWVDQRRRLADDFASLFGDESAVMPPVIAIAAGADSDNSGGDSLAYLARLRWVD
ncbi:hypothetical protein RF819_06000 [Rhodoferax fermentans]|uniref:DUF3047 domain-containing protein n=2 Tax=Rhodoferax fermentans TaxID=28066 RepID=A0A1T1AXS7_RHOFE|nr:hypothetical protein RF819_06000 [Rhodoferax fermentans]